jgi:hypothetical protein
MKAGEGRKNNFTHPGGFAAFLLIVTEAYEMNYWKGEITFTMKEDKRMFSALSWLAKAASRDTTRYFMTGIFNEVIDGNRVFVAMDGRHLHKIEFPGKPGALSGIPEGKNLVFKAGSKQITFTQEIDGIFPNYKQVIPDITDIEPFEIFVHKSKEIGMTECLYALYSRNIPVNALHVEGLCIAGGAVWNVYHVKHPSVAVCTQYISGAIYTAVSALLGL